MRSGIIATLSFSLGWILLGWFGFIIAAVPITLHWIEDRPDSALFFLAGFLIFGATNDYLPESTFLFYHNILIILVWFGGTVFLCTESEGYVYSLEVDFWKDALIAIGSLIIPEVPVLLIVARLLRRVTERVISGILKVTTGIKFFGSEIVTHHNDSLLVAMLFWAVLFGFLLSPFDYPLPVIGVLSGAGVGFVINRILE